MQQSGGKKRFGTDFNSVEELQRDLRQAVHAGKPSAVAELKRPLGP